MDQAPNAASPIYQRPAVNETNGPVIGM